MEPVGIKNIEEIIDAVESLSIDAIVGISDGLDWQDLKIIPNNMEKIKLALADLKEVSGEVGDIDDEEAKVLITKCVTFGFNLYSTIKKVAKK
jgi:hypothetical protein